MQRCSREKLFMSTDTSINLINSQIYAQNLKNLAERYLLSLVTKTNERAILLLAFSKAVLLVR